MIENLGNESIIEDWRLGEEINRIPLTPPKRKKGIWTGGRLGRYNNIRMYV